MSNPYGPADTHPDDYSSTSDAANVVVGLDKSVSADAALDLAAREATARGAALRIVHAHSRPARQPSAESRAVLDDALDRVGRLHPGLQIQHTLVGGGAGEVLVDESGRSQLLVLGGLGGPGAGTPAGSVLAHVVARAYCPVLVTGPAVATLGLDDPVRVAVSGSVTSLNALRFGCDWALRHGTAVEAWCVRDGPAAGEQAQLDAWISSVAREYASVVITSKLVDDTSAADAIAGASHGAQILAIGAGTAPHHALNLVAAALLAKAACAIGVVRSAPATPL